MISQNIPKRVSEDDYAIIINLMELKYTCEYSEPKYDNLNYLVDKGDLDSSVDGEIDLQVILTQLGKDTTFIDILLNSINEKGYDNDVVNFVVLEGLKAKTPKIFDIEDYILNFWLDFNTNKLLLKAYVLGYAINKV